MKKEIKALSKFDLLIEMMDFETEYPNVTYSNMRHVVDYDGNDFWIVDVNF